MPRRSGSTTTGTTRKGSVKTAQSAAQSARGQARHAPRTQAMARGTTLSPSEDLIFRSRVTSQGQVTLPSAIRTALGVRAGVDEIQYILHGNHLTVHRVRRPGEDDDDPTLGRYLDFLERDLIAHPERIRRIPSTLLHRMRELSANVMVNYDEPIDGPVAL